MIRPLPNHRLVVSTLKQMIANGVVTEINALNVINEHATIPWTIENVRDFFQRTNQAVFLLENNQLTLRPSSSSDSDSDDEPIRPRQATRPPPVVQSARKPEAESQPRRRQGQPLTNGIATARRGAEDESRQPSSSIRASSERSANGLQETVVGNTCSRCADLEEAIQTLDEDIKTAKSIVMENKIIVRQLLEDKGRIFQAGFTCEDDYASGEEHKVPLCADFKTNERDVSPVTNSNGENGPVELEKTVSNITRNESKPIQNFHALQSIAKPTINLDASSEIDSEDGNEFGNQQPLNDREKTPIELESPSTSGDDKSNVDDKVSPTSQNSLGEYFSIKEDMDFVKSRGRNWQKILKDLMAFTNLNREEVCCYVDYFANLQGRVGNLSNEQIIASVLALVNADTRKHNLKDLLNDFDMNNFDLESIP